mmetsp:Transcript_7572/g.20127  ORF Transcript_7572/g.20127 Transcript_7572/m.20127 type:complete len:148 (+) Transcript_7572:2-445(+)
MSAQKNSQPEAAGKAENCQRRQTALRLCLDGMCLSVFPDVSPRPVVLKRHKSCGELNDIGDDVRTTLRKSSNSDAMTDCERHCKTQYVRVLPESVWERPLPRGMRRNKLSIIIEVSEDSETFEMIAHQNGHAALSSTAHSTPASARS